MLKAGKASVIKLRSKKAEAAIGKVLKAKRQISTERSSPILELIKYTSAFLMVLIRLLEMLMAVVIAEKRFSFIIISAAPLATSVPRLPIAIPTSAMFKA